MFKNTGLATMFTRLISLLDIYFSSPSNRNKTWIIWSTCNFGTTRGTQKLYSCSSEPWTSEGFFSGVANQISRGGQNDEISFYPLQTKRTTFFAKSLIGKCQILKSRRVKAPTASFSNAHAQNSVSCIIILSYLFWECCRESEGGEKSTVDTETQKWVVAWMFLGP